MRVLNFTITAFSTYDDESPKRVLIVTAGFLARGREGVLWRANLFDSVNYTVTEQFLID